MWVLSGIVYLAGIILLLFLLCVCLAGIAFIVIVIGVFVEKMENKEGCFHKAVEVLDDWYW